MKKTNAMRILDSKNIDYKEIQYTIDDGEIDGISVAKKINKKAKEVYKTLVTRGQEENYIFIIPVDQQLDLKRGAKFTLEKKIEFIPINDILKITGYIRGGCSPIGMKKEFKTFIQEDALSLDTIIVSAGKIGQQIELSPFDLKDITNASFENIIK